MNDKMREEFEVLYVGDRGNSLVNERYEDGRYVYLTTEIGWAAWQAAKATQSELIADAERYRWLKSRLLCADFCYGDPSEAVCALVFEIPEDMQVSADLDATIDAVKEQP